VFVVDVLMSEFGHAGETVSGARARGSDLACHIGETKERSPAVKGLVADPAGNIDTAIEVHASLSRTDRENRAREPAV
jgi:hypothetical protein